MKAKFGVLFIVTGLVLLGAALSLHLSNEHRQIEAAKAVDEVMPKIVVAINENQAVAEDKAVEFAYETVPGNPMAEKKEMSVLDIDGRKYVGFVGLASLQLELPVIADWNYTDLEKYPCRYSGTTYGDNLVIMAHNYDRHFGRISNLSRGEEVTFTDAEGKTLSYEVVAVDVLTSTDIENMTAGEYDLTLFTCDYSGNNRVTVRCDRIAK